VKAKLNILAGSENSIIFSSTADLLLTDPLPSRQVGTPSPLAGGTMTCIEGGRLCGKGTEYDWNSASFFAHGKELFPLRDVQLL